MLDTRYSILVTIKDVFNSGLRQQILIKIGEHPLLFLLFNPSDYKSRFVLEK